MRRLPLLGLAGAIAGATGLAVTQRNRALSGVADDLRRPALMMPISFASPLGLRLGRAMLGRPTPVGDGVVTREERVGDASVVVYERADRTPDAASGALLWIHGGGLIMGAAVGNNDFCSHVAAELGVLVVSVDYRLAPEHPFPAGLDDCYAALAWIHDRADELGVDRTRVAVGGSSAGGGLTAAVVQMAHDRGGPPVCFQLLQYPMLDDRTALRRDPAATGAIVWTVRSNRYAWTAYLGHPPAADEDRPYAAPARRERLTGLPPAWIGVGDIDLFHDEDVDYATRLERDGVPCELHVVPGMYHAADGLAASAASMEDFRRRMIDALRTAIG
jgi:acetyl esterase/lipase